MPIYIYQAKNIKKACAYCKKEFEVLQQLSDNPVKHCPMCKGAVIKVMTTFFTGASKTGLDSKFKDKGFHKLKRVDKGKYEKLY